MRTVVVLIRLDVEDFVTPESDEAAFELASVLLEQGLPATVALTAWASRALRLRGHGELRRVLSPMALAFHSTSHSVHPTIAEELEQAADAEAPARFRERERDGFAEVVAFADRLPSAYVPPPANFAAECAEALATWEVPLLLAEEKGTPFRLGGRPYALHGVLLLAPSILTGPGGSNILPLAEERYDEVRRFLREAYARVQDEGEGDVGFLLLPLQPSELATEEPWDHLNFPEGQNRGGDTFEEGRKGKWRLPRRRPRTVREESIGVLRRLLAEMRRWPGLEFGNAEDVIASFPDEAGRYTFTLLDVCRVARAFAAGEVGSLALKGVPLSPSEALGLLAQAWCAVRDGEERRPLRLPPPAPLLPAAWDGEEPEEVTYEVLDRLAVEVRAGRLPSEPKAARRDVLAVALARGLIRRLEEGRRFEALRVGHVTFLPERLLVPEEMARTETYTSALYPAEFFPERLYRRARAALFSLKPMETARTDFRL